MILDSEYIFITDIGSTTTKGLLIKFDSRNSRYDFIAQADAYTTVEKPFEDVNIGIRTAIKRIEKISDIQIMDAKNNFLIPYLTTSSAGGGLQILVCGLTKVDTGKNAEITALGAGGIVLKTLSIDDGLTDFKRINVINKLNPDMILMAGGYNGGNNYATLRLIQMMILASPRNRFDNEMKIPLIYCGNTKMQRHINSMLPKHYIVSCTENIRPDYDTYNFGPTKQKIHEVFKESVMEHAPGYSYLKDLTSTDIRPTPTAVEQILKLYVEKHKENIIAIDMGGATTDIYTWIKGYFNRTVSANVGLSFSMANILATVLKNKNISEITDYLPSNYTEDNIRNYINNKTLNPSYLPTSDSERYLEQLCATLGFELSFSQHLDMNFNNLRNDIFDRINSIFSFIYGSLGKKLLKKEKYVEDGYKFYNEDKFYLSDIQTIIGSGGVIAYAHSREEQISMLNEGLKPYGLTKLMIDKPFKVSHMGILSYVDPKSALEMFERECLETIAFIVAPLGKIKPDKPVITIKNNKTGKLMELVGGQIVYAPNGGDLDITAVGRNIRVDKATTFQKIRTDKPILFDCRGRGKHFINNPLLKSNIEEFKFNYGIFTSNIGLNKIDISNLIYEDREFTGNLPHDGEILVEKGNYVKAGDIIGKNESETQSFFYIDVNHLSNAKKNYTASEVKERLNVKIGQHVKAEDVIFRGYSIKVVRTTHKRGFGITAKFKEVLIETDFTAKRSGLVTEIYYDLGLISFEVIERNETAELDAGKFFFVTGSKINSLISVKLGDPVKENQTIGYKLTRDKGQISLKSPIKGIVTKIDTDKGTVTIENKVTPYLLKSFVSGEVTAIENDRSVTVSSKCVILQGATGFGGETHGVVLFVNDMKKFKRDSKQSTNAMKEYEDKILIFKDMINFDILESTVKFKVNGIVAPSINNKDWAKFSDKELSVSFTGDEDFGFSLVLIKGFGNHPMEEDLANLLNNYQMKDISITGRTQIRAGIVRPQVVLPEI